MIEFNSPIVERLKNDRTDTRGANPAESIAQDVWFGGTVPGGRQQDVVSSNESVNKIAERVFRSEDKASGFARQDAHEGPGLLTPASLRDNLRKSAHDELPKDYQDMYAREGYKPWIKNNDRIDGHAIHAAVDAKEKQMENDIVKKAFGDLSIDDQHQLLASDTKSQSVEYENAVQRFTQEISKTAHRKIVAESVVVPVKVAESRMYSTTL